MQKTTTKQLVFWITTLILIIPTYGISLLVAVIWTVYKQQKKQKRSQAITASNNPPKKEEKPDKIKRPRKTTKTVRETKCICLSCGDVWHYNMADEFDQCANAMSNSGKAMMCCGGCVPALWLPKREKGKQDLTRCPKCKSRSFKKETVSHEVPKKWF